MKKERNLAFIDGQNLYLGTTANDWKVDHYKFRVYLKDKYHITEAYYFLGYITEKEQKLYSNLQKAGFIVLFKEHNPLLMAQKKGNVDTDIVFEVMKSLIDENFDKVLLVSGDGDYIKLVDYLVSKSKFKKIVFPNKKFASSSLYKELGSEFFDYIENIKSYIKLTRNEKGS